MTMIEREKVINSLTKQMYRNQKMTSKRRGMEQPSYTQQELTTWVKNQPHFMDIYTNWINSDCKRTMVPSIDRINSQRGYDIDNIQLMTFRENLLKGNEVTGQKFNLARQVKQLTVNNELIKIFDSAHQASEETGIERSNISVLCGKNKNQGKTAGGFKWEYIE